MNKLIILLFLLVSQSLIAQFTGEWSGTCRNRETGIESVILLQANYFSHESSLLMAKITEYSYHNKITFNAVIFGGGQKNQYLIVNSNIRDIVLVGIDLSKPIAFKNTKEWFGEDFWYSTTSTCICDDNYLLQFNIDRSIDVLCIDEVIEWKLQEINKP